MRISDVFSMIHTNEFDISDMEEKYDLIRFILDKKLADKADFKTVILNHNTIKKEFALSKNISEDYVNELIIDIYNYPEIIIPFKDILSKFKYEILDDDTEASSCDGSKNDCGCRGTRVRIEKYNNEGKSKSENESEDS